MHLIDVYVDSKWAEGNVATRLVMIFMLSTWNLVVRPTFIMDCLAHCFSPVVDPITTTSHQADNEIALYLMESMGETLTPFSMVELVDQLLQARKKISHVSLEQRVAAALSSLVRISSEDTLQ